FAFGAKPFVVVRLHALRVLDQRLELGQPSLLGHSSCLELLVATPRRCELAPGSASSRAALLLGVADERVENLELIRGSAKSPLLELPRHCDQPVRRAGHVLPGGASAPGVSAGPAVGEDAPGQHEALLVAGAELRQGFEAVLLEERRRQVELGLDVRLLALRADEARLALRAEQQADRLRQDRLAGPGL